VGRFLRHGVIVSLPVRAFSILIYHYPQRSLYRGSIKKYYYVYRLKLIMLMQSEVTKSCKIIQYKFITQYSTIPRNIDLNSTVLSYETNTLLWSPVSSTGEQLTGVPKDPVDPVGTGMIIWELRGIVHNCPCVRSCYGSLWPVHISRVHGPCS